MFLFVYDTEPNAVSRIGCDEKTYRKWIWFYAEAISKLDKIFVSSAALLLLCLQSFLISFPFFYRSGGRIDLEVVL